MNFGLIGTKRNEYQAREAMNRICQGKVTHVEIANPDPHAPRSAAPPSREREMPLAHRMGEGVAKRRVRATADRLNASNR